MSKTEDGQVYFFDNDDPEMQQAQQNARETFGAFWREIAWERRRIVPALDMACVKIPFSDGDGDASQDDRPEVEQMWVSEVDFDGQFVSGILINSPKWLKSVKEGDSVRVPLTQVYDWMYSIDDQVYGAHTVNLMRARMSPEDQAEHDAAWGLEFGDPDHVRLAYERESGDWRAEHPMSINMAPSLKEHLAENPEMIHEPDDQGWTTLHHEALAGSLATVQVLLDHGADPKAVNGDDRTPLQLAESLGWEDVAALLRGKMSD